MTPAVDPLTQMLLDAEAEEKAQQEAALRQRAEAVQARAPAPTAAPARAPASEAPAAAQPSLGDRFKRAAQMTLGRNRPAQEVLSGAGAGIVRAPGVLVGSLVDFANDTDRFVGDVADSALTRVGAGGFVRWAQEGRAVQAESGRRMRAAFGQDSTATWSDMLSARQTLGKVGNDAINQGAAVVVASIIPALATGGASVAPTLAGTAARTATIGAFGGGVINSPTDERLANGLQQLGVRNEFVDWMAQDDDDSAMESRFKGALEGILAEGAFEAVFYAAKAAIKFSKGLVAEGEAARKAALDAAGITDPGPVAIREASPSEVAQENLDKSFASARTEEARAKQITDDIAKREEAANGTAGQGGAEGSPPPKPKGDEAAPVAESLDAGTRARDAAPEVAAPYESQRITNMREALDTGVMKNGLPVDDETRTLFTDAIARFEASDRAVLQDANAALARAGVAEQLDELVVSPTGKIEVSAQTKAALDEAGMGRAFAVPENAPRDSVVFATQGRVIGSMGRADVQAFKDEVAGFTPNVGDIPANNPAGAFKISTLGEPENVQPLIRALVQDVPAKGVVSVDQMQAAARQVADEVGEDINSILAFAQGVADDVGGMYAAVGGIRTMWTRLAANIDRHLTANIDELGDDAFKALAEDIHNAMTFSGSFGQVKTGLGRGVYSLRLADADTYLANVGKFTDDALTPGALDAQPPLPRTKEEVKDWLDAWKAFDGDPTGRAKWLENKLKLPTPGLYLRQSVANLFTANLLSAPRTLALNVVGPSLVGALRTLEKTTGGFMAALNPTIKAARRQELLATATQAPIAYVQAFNDFQDAIRFGIAAMKRGETILGGGGAIRDGATQLGPISPALLRASQGKPAWQYSLGNVINVWPRALQKLNAGLDETAKRISYFGEARAGLLVDGATKGLRGQELNEYVRNGLIAQTDALGHSTNEQLLRSAERSTFTGQVGGDGGQVRAFAQGLQNARKQYPELRFILPIFNVPANALGETLRRVPGLNFAFKESNRELAGELGAVAQAEAYGRFVTGASLLGSGFALSRMGLITGSGPKDPRDRAVWLQTHQPYSLRVGDQWVDYSRYDLIGAMLAIPATVFDRTVNSRQDQGWEHTMYAGVASLAEYFKDRAALQAVSDLLTFSSSPTANPASFFERLQGTVAANLLVPNFVTALGRNPTDDVVRAKAGVADYIFDKLPYFSQQLDPVRNVLGEYVHKPQDSLMEGILPITMAQAVSYADDPVLDEVSRLYEVTGYAAGVQSPGQTMGGFFDPREVKLEDGNSLWNTIGYHKQMVQVNGRTLREALTDLFDSSEYNDAVDADASNKYLDDGRTSRGALVADVFEDFNKAARQATAQESPIAARWLATVAVKRTNDGVLRSTPARELVDNPDLLASLGIDITVYEQGLTGQ